MQHTIPTLIETIKEADGSLSLSLIINADLIFFSGHFDQAAILPGVAQIKIADHFARQLFEQYPSNNDFLRAENIKFQALIRPNQSLTLNIQFDLTRGKLSFRYNDDSTKFSSGRLIYAPKET